MVAQEVKSSIQVACIESQSIVVEDKQNYYHPLPVSVKAHLTCHSNSRFVCKWYSWKRLKGAISLESFCHGTAAFMYIPTNTEITLGLAYCSTSFSQLGSELKLSLLVTSKTRTNASALW